MSAALLFKFQPRRSPRDAEGHNEKSSLCASASSAVHSRRSRISSRRGISLLEVLISMGVLAVGLLGVAALIPAGRHEIAEASRLDNAAMVGRAAFRDLQIRGFLNPGDAAGTSPRWRDATGIPVWQPTGPIGNAAQPFVVNSTASDRVAFALDPLGAVPYGPVFPAGSTVLNLTRIAPVDVTAPGAMEFMDTIFRSSVDLMTVGNTDDSDLPPEQVIFTERSGAVIGIPVSDIVVGTDTPLRRASAGDYSWLATIVSDPTKSALSSKVTVSVAVFHKRDLTGPGTGEYFATSVTFPNANPLIAGAGAGGGEMRLVGAPRAVRPGEWLMLAGRQSIANLDYFHWYRVVSAQKQSNGEQNVTLAGADWDPQLLVGAVGVTQAFLFDNIVAVYEKTLSLEIE